MAKTGFWLHGAKGKLAGTTMYRGRKGTIQREIVTPRNPKTTAQVMQRLVFATVARTAASLKGIVDHSFEGIPYGQQSMEFFKKQALAIFKQHASNPHIAENAPYAPLLPLGTLPKVKVAANAEYMVSRGSLLSFDFELETLIAGDNWRGSNLAIVTPISGVTDLTTLEFSDINKLGWDISCQHTIILMGRSFMQINEERIGYVKPVVARLNFNTLADPETKVFISGVDSEGETAIRINPDALIEDESDNYQYLEFMLKNSGTEQSPEYTALKMGIGELDLSRYYSLDGVRAAPVIKSKKSGDEWLRSTQYMQMAFIRDEEFAIDEWNGNVWNNVTTLLNLAAGGSTYPSDWYLNKEKNPQ